MTEPNLISVTAAGASQLRLVYETGEVKLFDVAPYIRGSWYGELQNPEYFRSVHLIDGGAGLRGRTARIWRRTNSMNSAATRKARQRFPGA